MEAQFVSQSELFPWYMQAGVLPLLAVSRKRKLSGPHGVSSF